MVIKARSRASRKFGAAFALLILVSCKQSSLPTEPSGATGTGNALTAESSSAGQSGRRRVANPAPSCVSVAGTFDVIDFQSDANCPTDNYQRQWTFEQRGCTATEPIFPDAPAVNAEVRGSQVTLHMRNGFIACLYDLQGTGVIEGNTIRATVTGPVSGPCCGTKQETLHIVAVRRP
ncbi:MAG TPA: hypothetical protein VEZ11_12520 [Thermoanaerobaculia bacterium]|nr:hypothetical protein [Thermoanaerobaculia bacterium]